MKRGFVPTLAAAVLLAAGGMVAAAGGMVAAGGESTRTVDKALRATRPEPSAERGIRGAGRFLSAARGGYPSRAGWTNRRYQRAAAKARNVARNRRAHR